VGVFCLWPGRPGANWLEILRFYPLPLQLIGMLRKAKRQHNSGECEAYSPRRYADGVAVSITARISGGAYGAVR
jgi:hypothetical protein